MPLIVKTKYALRSQSIIRIYTNCLQELQVLSASKYTIYGFTITIFINVKIKDL
jgi:hypothetical protein